MARCKFSIVIPMYNASKTIGRCLDSILNQKCESFEVICVDDGSTDATIESIKRNYGSSVRVILSKHKGASNARNIGIREAMGEYILFCDADDEYFPDAFATLSQECNAEIVFFGAKVIDCNEKYHLNDIEIETKRYAKKPENFFYTQKYVWPYVWHCAYQTEFLRKNGIRFSDKLTLGEDLAFQFEATMMAKSVNCIDSVLYKYYHCRQGSSEMAFLSNPVERVKKHIKIIETCYELFDKHSKRPDKEFYDFAFEFLYRDIAKLNRRQHKEVTKDMRNDKGITFSDGINFIDRMRIKTKKKMLKNYLSVSLYTKYKRGNNKR